METKWYLYKMKWRKKAKNKIYLFIFPQMMIKMVKRMKIVRYPFQVRFYKEMNHIDSTRDLVTVKYICV